MPVIFNDIGGSIMQTHPTPFLVVNPKSYLYGEEALALAKASDAVDRKSVV